MDIKRISTGITGLDPLLQGGFIQGRSYLVSGGAGTGKTTACIQFLMTGLNQGEKTAYVTVDERPTEILQAANSLGWDLHSYMQDKSLVILDAAPYLGNRSGAGVEKSVDFQRIVSDLASYTKRMDVTRLVIDPVTPLFLTGDSHVRVQEHARTLIHLLQSQLNTTNLLTSHAPRNTDHDLTNGIEEFLAAGVLVLKVTQANGRFVRTLGIIKMRGTAVEPAEYPFSIVKGKGILLNDKKQVPVGDVEEQPVQTLEFFEPSKEEM